MTKRVVATMAALALALAGGAASAHSDDDADATRCDTFKRTSTTYSHDNRNPNDVDVDEEADTPEDLYVMDGGDGQGRGPRYGVRGRDFYIEAIGGGGYGAGQADDPQHRAGEGGVVQGEVDVDDDGVPMGGSIPDADFAVDSFSMDDPLDHSHFYDTSAGACVSVGNQKVSTGEQYVATHNLTNNGCRVSNPPVDGVTTTTTTCEVFLDGVLIAAVNGSWSYVVYKTPKTANPSSCQPGINNSNVQTSGSGSGPTVKQVNYGAGKHCVRLTIGSSATGLLAMTG